MISHEINVKQHPLMEVIARKLSGIESVPRKAQARMVLAACRAARIYHDAEIERLRARVAELEAVRPTRCPRDFDATPRDYTGKTDGMSAELEARPKQCRWHATNEDEYPGVYTTECGHMFSFDEGDRAENDAVYCQYCGGLIVEDAK